MADQEVINKIYKRFEEVRPGDFISLVEETGKGMPAVVKILDKSAGPVSAGEISRCLNISTARVAVMLKKMEAKGFIQKSKSKEDARVTLVEMTDLGKKKAAEMKNDARNQFIKLIDNMGEEKLMAFCDVLEEMKTVMLEKMKEKQEEEDA